MSVHICIEVGADEKGQLMFVKWNDWQTEELVGYFVC
jgi:hypothetical protein